MTIGNDIEIPGYVITGELGSGGMATVYLAIQKSFEREVALKVMSPLLNSDKSFGERFLREARIVAQMRHHNIVSVYDVGQHEKYHYLSMEILPCGDVKQKLATEAGPALALSVSMHIASALNYAHNKGYLHRDIKPENIMFREDGTPVLTDFGIARAIEASSSMTKTGTMVGTPSYMSPEQASGTTLDNRCDIYSLGIVFFELLTGAPPYKADSAIALALKHINAPVPELPSEYGAYQTIINKVLAKDRDDRFSTCEELFLALQEVGVQQENDRTIILPRIKHNSAPAPIPTPVISLTGQPSITSSNYEIADTIQPKEQKNAKEAPIKQRPLSPLTSGLLAGALLTGAAFFLYQQVDLSDITSDGSASIPVSHSAEEWLNKAKVHEELNEYEQALQAYFTALTIDANSKQAGEGVDRLVDHYITSAQKAFDENKIALAQSHLFNIIWIDPDNKKATLLQAKIKTQIKETEQKEHITTQITRLLILAEKSIQNHQLSEPENANALSYYRNILELDPGNKKAHDELLRLSDRFLLKADNLIGQAEFDAANEQIQLALKAAPKNPDIKRKLADLDIAHESHREKLVAEAVRQEKLLAQQRLAEERRKKELAEKQRRLKREQEINILLIAAQKDIDNFRTYKPKGNNATEKFHRVLKIEPKNANAIQGLKRIVDPLFDSTKSSLNKKDFDSAKGYLALIESIYPEHKDLPASRSHYNTLKDKHEKQVKQREINTLAAMESISIGQKLLAQNNANIDTIQLVSTHYNKAARLAPNLNEVKQLKNEIIALAELTASSEIENNNYQVAYTFLNHLHLKQITSNKLNKLESESRKYLEKNLAISQLLSAAKQNMKDSRSYKPKGDNAADKYRQVLLIDKNNREAITGIKTIAQPLLTSADQAIENNDEKEARNNLATAYQIFPQHPEFNKIKPEYDKKLSKMIKNREMLAKQQKMKQAMALVAQGHQILNKENISISDIKSANEYYEEANNVAGNSLEAKTLRQQIIQATENLASSEFVKENYNEVLEITTYAHDNNLNNGNINKIAEQTQAQQQQRKKRDDTAIISVF